MVRKLIISDRIVRGFDYKESRRDSLDLDSLLLVHLEHEDQTKQQRDKRRKEKVSW